MMMIDRKYKKYEEFVKASIIAIAIAIFIVLITTVDATPYVGIEQDVQDSDCYKSFREYKAKGNVVYSVEVVGNIGNLWNVMLYISEIGADNIQNVIYKKLVVIIDNNMWCELELWWNNGW